ncbi:alpha/beta-hydrolase [Dichomitus squalens LYAD-421 SS1]|uniref:Alpha/beta-hydrolase n=1 Tax=Dichomitus squalens (strain LYAD-421) TaxID=732165 RepID=R7T0D7_DICSQ|nr:alpha/beta-hydrolase [Dichomitus squalens LYAD-421 SS1]EJF61455.1 alpha/beta-hydrolase [Dichomitus squalens LYAD-421 SS1]
MQASSSSIQWVSCDPSVVSNPALSCGFFDIPLDYHDPAAGRGRLAVIKANATGPRRGTVFFNPGGPGGSGLEALDADAAVLGGLTGGVYDIVSWDPRGVGALTVPGEIFCFGSAEEHDAFFNGTIELTGVEYTGSFTDPADVHALFSQTKVLQHKYEEVGRKCLEGPSGRYLKYVGAAATVRDMIALADALDGEGAEVNYVGVSYGTLLGSWFVNMFPDRVGRVILDGVVDPVSFATEQISLNAANFLLKDADKVYEAFITGCLLSGTTGCPIAANASSPEEVNQNVQALLRAAHDAARRDPSVAVSSSVIRSLLYTQMESPEGWSQLANVTYPQLVQAVAQEVSESTFLPSRFGRPRNPLRSRSSASETGVSYTSQAIWCGDSVDRASTTMLNIFDDLVAGTRRVSHLFGGLWPTAFYSCPFWPVRSVERYRGPFNRTLANKILVASNLLDPATPIAGAQRVAGLLGENATLVTQNAFGHTTLSEPSTCVSTIMMTYMLTGKLPEGPVVCEVDGGFEMFEGVDTSDILARLSGPDVRTR